MATNPEHGTAGLMAEISAGEAAQKSGDDENAAEDEIATDLFGDSALMPTLVVGKTKSGQPITKMRSGPGRPPGSSNLATEQLRKLVMTKYGHPVLRLAELASTPLEILALTLKCSMLEAAEFSRKCQNDVASYVAHKLPQSVQVELKTAGMLAIYTGQPPQEGETTAHGLDMKLVNGEEKTIDNQILNKMDDEKCHGESVTDGDK